MKSRILKGTTGAVKAEGTRGNSRNTQQTQDSTPLKQNVTSVTPEAAELLARLLGQSDAIWLPCRDFKTRFSVNCYVARTEFLRTGLRFTSGASTPAAAKVIERQISDLSKDGLIEVFRPAGAKISGIRLADAGDEAARLLVGLPALLSSLSWLREVARLAAESGSPWVDEFALATFEPVTTDELVLTENMSLASLSRGYGLAWCSFGRRCFYAVTARGRAWLESNPTPGDDELPITDEAKRLRGVYDATVVAGLAELESRTGNERQIGSLPFSYPATPVEDHARVWGGFLPGGPVARGAAE